MSDVVERLRDWPAGGQDMLSSTVVGGMMEEAADEIERLREALHSIEGQAVCVALPHKATEADDMLENIAGIAARALELKGNQ